ncbi:hypothetical protein [Nocardia sp. NPDC059239]|uniref:hypothetical protein n=1 Tax=Nocardia sp. NPDC059239 TaxID=3346785 RepID=UPI00368E6F89
MNPDELLGIAGFGALEAINHGVRLAYRTGKMVNSIEHVNEAEQSLSELRSDCLLASKFLGSTFLGLNLMLLRHKGAQAVKDLQVIEFQDHQADHFIDGMTKLGIIGDPPAVAAAKYHYFSNILGGLDVEYIEETPKKVWLRYNGPSGMGLGMIPGGAFRRYLGGSWHRLDGKFMGVPNLGWVATKALLDGDPYDEGYFIEYDHEVDFNEPLKIELVDSTPEFDPCKAPQLDPSVWTEERRLKVLRSYSRTYVFSAFRALTKLQGEVTASWLLEETMRRIAVQYTRELRQDMGLESSGIALVRDFTLGLLRACGQEFSILEDGAKAFSIRVSPIREFKAVSSDRVHAALFSFYATAVRILDGHTRISRVPDEGKSTAVWHFKDEGKWLW